MTLILRWLKGFGRFWYGFIVGDDWAVAAVGRSSFRELPRRGAPP